MRISTPNNTIAEEIIKAIAKKGGKKYQAYSGGIIEDVSVFYEPLIRENFDDMGVYINGQPVKAEKKTPLL